MCYYGVTSIKEGEKMSEKAELKDRLRKALELREKKAVDLSKDLKIPKSAISQYLSGYRTIKDSKRLYIIAEYLDVSEAWLMGFDVPMERHLARIEEQPVEEANKLADWYLDLEFKDDDLQAVVEVFKQLDGSGKEQLKAYANFLLTMKEGK